MYLDAVFAPTGGAGTADNLVTVVVAFFNENDDISGEGGLTRGTKGTFGLTNIATNITEATAAITDRAAVSITGNDVTVVFATPLPGPASYRLSFDGGVVRDAAGNGCGNLGAYVANGKVHADTTNVQPVVATTVTRAAKGVTMLDKIPTSKPADNGGSGGGGEGGGTGNSTQSAGDKKIEKLNDSMSARRGGPYSVAAMRVALCCGAVLLLAGGVAF